MITLGSSIEELTNNAVEIIEVGRKMNATLAMIIFKAKELFGIDSKGFFGWCSDNAKLTGSYVHQHVKVGKMLISLQDKEEIFKMLTTLDFAKLIPLSRLGATEIISLVASYNFETMNREEVRNCVNNLLNGFDASKNLLDTKSTNEQNSLVQDELTGFTTAVNSVIELATNGFDFENAITNDEIAEKATGSGMVFIGATIEYQKKSETPDYQLLQAMKESLEKDIVDINNILGVNK